MLLRASTPARLLALALLCSAQLQSQRGAPGHSIGKVTLVGNLIHIEVDSGALAPEHLFDLDHRTLRFTPEGNGYRLETVPLQWETTFGAAVQGPVTLHNFQFPFSGRSWRAFNVALGSITFGDFAATGRGRGSGVPAGNRTGAGGSIRAGFQMDRYASMATVGSTFVNMIAGIAVYVRNGWTGQRYANELADRVVVTWTLSEPSGGIQAFSWTPTIKRFQAVLHRDGEIDLSYNDVHAGDGVVGLFPLDSTATGARRDADLSTVTSRDGPFTDVYEGFYWAQIPRAVDVACTVIQALGDRFDFLASYSDFRVDNPEGGTPSTGPRGGNVTGIGSTTGGLDRYCSQGRLQWMFVEPVSTAAIQIQKDAPGGAVMNTDYNYAMSQIGHELAHRWLADADALVNGDRIRLGPVHWATGLQVPAAFPYSKPVEADAMGGGVWRDNGDGTFTQLDDDYYVPANGYSWLDLYLMGLAKAEEVPDFFIIRNLQPTTQRDSAGHRIYRGERTNLTIQDVIAAMGPREPDVEHSQKAFNTGMVVMTMPGKAPSRELIEAANAIAAHWVAYWSKSTGGRATMTTVPK